MYQRKRENLAEISFPAIAPTGVQTMHVNVPKHISDFTTMERMPSRMKTRVAPLTVDDTRASNQPGPQVISSPTDKPTLPNP